VGVGREELKLRIPENLTQQAYQSIRDEIIKGRLDGRQHLTEGYFASRFGISKSPIREALNRLESESLITIIPRRGAFVSKFSIHDIEEIYELREILEALVVRDAVLDSKTLRGMRESVDAAKACMRRNDIASYIREDATFHTRLAQASSNSRLRKILENMHNQMLILRRKTFELTSHTSVAQHTQILRALEQGRKDVAAKLMVRHIRTVRKRLIDHLKRRGIGVTAAKGL
jgi:DNA-binding GntR family transcriptional regulator